MKKSLSLIFASATIFGLAACNESGAKSDSMIHPLGDSTVIIKYKGGTITAKEVNELLKPQFKRMEEEIMDTYRKGAERALLMKLLEAEAKAQGVGSAEALMAKVASEVTVTDAQVKDFYKANKFEKGIKDPKTGKVQKVNIDDVKKYLADQERQQKQQSFLQGIMAKAEPTTVLEEPKIAIEANANSPFKGGKDSKVIVYEFSDFQCPYCARGRSVVDQLSAHYGDKIKIVFRHFPLDFHPEALPSAIASMCAHRDGKFWQMHDKLFDAQAELGEAKILSVAKEIGVDMAKFESCFKNKETEADVRKDMAAAEAAGVNSTPTFIVNGKKVAGAAPFEQFRTMIDAELKK